MSVNEKRLLFKNKITFLILLSNERRCLMIYVSLVTFLTLHLNFTIYQLRGHTYADHVGQNPSAGFSQVTVVTFCSSDGSQLWVQSKL